MTSQSGHWAKFITDIPLSICLHFFINLFDHDPSGGLEDLQNHAKAPMYLLVIISQRYNTISLLCRKICWFMVTAFMTSSTNRITRQFNPSWWEVSNLVSVTLVPSWTMLRVKSESFYVEWTSQETQEGKWDLVIKRFVHTIQVTFIHSKRNRVFKPVTEAFGFGFVSK